MFASICNQFHSLYLKSSYYKTLNKQKTYEQPTHKRRKSLKSVEFLGLSLYFSRWQPRLVAAATSSPSKLVKS